MMKRSIPLAALLAAAAIFDPRSAAANGVFPSAGQIVVDPSDPQHIVVRTTYGVLISRTGAEPWDWVCEGAVGYSSGVHPAVAVTEDGAVIAGLPDGLAVGRGDACAWERAAGPIAGAFVVDVARDKQTPSRAFAVSAKGAAGPARLWISEDNAATWAQAGADLPSGYTPLTIDPAPSDPQRIYVSAIGEGGATAKGALLVSANGGQTWAQFSVPMSDGLHAPYIAAVDPNDPDRVYLRTDGLPGRLLSFDYSTVKVTQIFSGKGYLRGFALSPDGATILVGGSDDGIQRASSSALMFEKVSDLRTRCLTWTAAGVYTCANEATDGFTIGLSKDEGASFEPLMHLACVRGPLKCAADTTAGELCPSEWAAVATQIGVDTCGVTPGSGGAGGAAGAGGASTTSASTTGGGGSSAPAPGGCSCGLSTTEGRGAGLLAALSVLLHVCRARRRANPRA